MDSRKPWADIAIHECGEALFGFPPDHFAFVSPHPYQALGAPYAGQSPFQLRGGVLQRLLQAHARLQQLQPGWKLLIFDAYRPNAVQRFMVEHTYETLLREQSGQGVSNAALWEKVYRFWAPPSDNPATPPAHSTGAAIDLSLVDAHGQTVDMGTPIDEFSERAYPEHFAERNTPQARQIHANRNLLLQAMSAGGFSRHPYEWWHFSYGDQLWAWLQQQQGSPAGSARYGRADLV